jgi:hypothetical protein
MKPKETDAPGPSKGPYSYRKVRGKLGIFSGFDGIQIASVLSPSHHAERDASLLASAPDLLAALRGALAWWSSDERRTLEKEPEWVQDARDAITKAGGSRPL